jgi:imidazolonepropionase-like amidohydrolase
VKLVGDWIDRAAGPDDADLAPLWPDEVLAEAIDAAHEAGARVTAHVFGTEALPGLIRAGIDCIEHGTGLSDELIEEMAARGTALVPTLINVETFPGIAEKATKYPRVRRSHARRCTPMPGRPSDARSRRGSRSTRAPTPAAASGTAGSPTRSPSWPAPGHPDPIGAASWAARSWLGRPAGPVPGAPADLVVYDRDPRGDLGVLRAPSVVLIRGRRVSTGA